MISDCPLADGIEDVNVRDVILACKKCSIDLCVARIEAEVARASHAFLNMKTMREINRSTLKAGD